MDPDGKASFTVLITPIPDRTIDQWADGIVDAAVRLSGNFELTSRQVTSFQGSRTILMQSRYWWDGELVGFADCTWARTDLVIDGPYVDMWLHMKVCENDMDRLQPQLDAILRSFTLY
jgi:hypothetical protein